MPAVSSAPDVPDSKALEVCNHPSYPKTSKRDHKSMLQSARPSLNRLHTHCQPWAGVRSPKLRKPSYRPSSSVPGSISTPKVSSPTRFIYPLILFSLLTSFTINLKANKLDTEAQVHRLNGQISVLERLILELRQIPPNETQRAQLLDSITSDLELVGLRDKSSNPTPNMARSVSWREVLLGRDGVETDNSDQESTEAVARWIEAEGSQGSKEL